MISTTDQPHPTSDAPSYAFRPSLTGAPWEFRLAPDALEWTAGRRAGRMAYRDLRRLRLSFRPVTMHSHRYVAEIWPAGGPKLQLASTSWKSMVEQERRDAPYAAFLRELHRRLAAAHPDAQFEAGSPPLIYWPGVVVFAAVALALAGLVVRTLQAQAHEGAAIAAVFLALFLWQAGTFLRRNRPRTYRPESIPPDLLP